MLCHSDETPQQMLLQQRLESELAQNRAEGQHQTQESEALLNIQVKLGSGIATDCSLLTEGEDINLGDSLDDSHSIQPIQKTTTHRLAKWCVRSTAPTF